MSDALKADLVIIGDGVAGLALAYLAAQRDIRTVILGKGFRGTTFSATGLIAPRPDYLVSDTELVRRTSFECLRWLQVFYPQILKPQRFLIPIGPELPFSLRTFKDLLKQYDEIAKARSTGLGRHFIVSQANLEKMEPNLRRNNIFGAISFGEWTVDPAVLLKKLGGTAVYTDMMKRFEISEFQSFKIKDGLIEEVTAEIAENKFVSVANDRGPLVVVNATGPWMKDVCARLGIVMDYQLKAGIQMEIPGWYFQSGIVTFGRDGKYLICLQKKGILQIGPTNSPFSGHPDSFPVEIKEAHYLEEALQNILEDKKLPPYSFLKHGFRVKPTWTDTNRPVIWNHSKSGIANLYSLHPGKMALALLAGDEMIDKAISDGWLARQKIVMANRIHLDGNRRLFNEFKLILLKIYALIRTGLSYLSPVTKTP